MSGAHEGSCLCGQVRFRVVGEPVEPVGNCHCRVCQKASGAAYMTWAIYPQSRVTWLREPPKWFRSTDFAERGFCSACGSPVAIHDFGHSTVDLPIVLFDNPNALRPVDDIWLQSRIAWVALDPVLAHYQQSGEDAE